MKDWLNRWSSSQPSDPVEEPKPVTQLIKRPNVLNQVQTLLKRRALLFVRDRAYWLLTLSITLGFPLLVAIFAWDGLPELRGLALSPQGGFWSE